MSFKVILNRTNFQVIEGNKSIQIQIMKILIIFLKYYSIKKFINTLKKSIKTINKLIKNVPNILIFLMIIIITMNLINFIIPKTHKINLLKNSIITMKNYINLNKKVMKIKDTNINK